MGLLFEKKNLSKNLVDKEKYLQRLSWQEKFIQWFGQQEKFIQRFDWQEKILEKLVWLEFKKKICSVINFWKILIFFLRRPQVLKIWKKPSSITHLDWFYRNKGNKNVLINKKIRVTLLLDFLLNLKRKKKVSPKVKFYLKIHLSAKKSKFWWVHVAKGKKLLKLVHLPRF